MTELGRPRRPPSGIYSRIANKISNLILVPFGPLAEWLKLSHRLSRHLVRVPSQKYYVWSAGFSILIVKCLAKFLLRTANQVTVRNGPGRGPELPLRMGVYGRLAMAR